MRVPESGGRSVHEPRARAAFPCLALLLLAPFCAEFLIGYDDITGRPLELLFAWPIMAALYGAPAVIIREVTRRRELHWPALLLFGVAFGLLQAGIVDQSLFNPDYRHIPGWADMANSTRIPWIGTSAFMLIHFVSGHMFGAIWAPIVITDALFRRRCMSPWLTMPGALALLAVWAAAALFVGWDQLQADPFRASMSQLGLTSACVLGFVLSALRSRNWRVPDGDGRRAPSPCVIAIATGALLGFRLVSVAIPASTDYNPVLWRPTVVMTAFTGVWIAAIFRWRRQRGWSDHHDLAAASAYLLAVAVAAFPTEPLGDVPLANKLATNTLFLVLVAMLVSAGWRGLERGEVCSDVARDR